MQMSLFAMPCTNDRTRYVVQINWDDKSSWTRKESEQCKRRNTIKKKKKKKK